MSNKVWDGSSQSFETSGAWSPAGVPTTGDVALISAGTVLAAAAFADGLTIDVNGSSSGSPVLQLTDTTLLSGDVLALSGGGGAATVQLRGRVTNQGAIQTSSTGFGSVAVSLFDGSGGAATTMVNTGSITVGGGTTQFGNLGTNAANSIENDGTITFQSSGGNTSNDGISVALTGTGTLEIGSGGALRLSAAVGSGQTVHFGSSQSGTLQIDNGATFSGTIAGFSGVNSLLVGSAPWVSAHYVDYGNSSGTIILSDANGTPVETLQVSGQYALDSFKLSQQTTSSTTATTVVTAGPSTLQRFAFSDVVANTSGGDTGIAYSGPVAGLEWQYIWSSADAVAISAATPNVFLKGNAGGDALAASSGTNVLDGAGGSNFLVGSTDPSSQDTFFVDGRGGVVTWSTIVNFHEGDAATFFGFQAGVSTMPYTASDGAAGYTGLTIHSELNGAGTGVNESMTFAGIDQATADAHFSITTGTLSPGTPDAIDYLLIQYNR